MVTEVLPVGRRATSAQRGIILQAITRSRFYWQVQQLYAHTHSNDIDVDLDLGLLDGEYLDLADPADYICLSAGMMLANNVIEAFVLESLNGKTKHKSYKAIQIPPPFVLDPTYYFSVHLYDDRVLDMQEDAQQAFAPHVQALKQNLDALLMAWSSDGVCVPQLLGERLATLEICFGHYWPEAFGKPPNGLEIVSAWKFDPKVESKMQISFPVTAPLTTAVLRWLLP